MRQELVIFVNGQRHTVAGGRAFQTLTDFLRRDLGLSGTKVVCAEGDCGSCTVLVGRVGDAVGDAEDPVAYSIVCGCIQLLGQLDGCHVVTVEGLSYGDRIRGADGDDVELPKLNPVQRAMAACHGAQCGYCTPGFVVAMHALLEDGRAREPEEVTRALTGNLCRCTGYEPILRAAVETDVARVRRVNDLYPAGDLAPRLRALAGESVLICAGDGRSFFKPTTLREALEFRAGNPSCAVVAGGTDLGVQINKRVRRPEVIMSLLAVPELRGVNVADGAVRVGASATLTELQRALARHVPEFARFLEWFGSPQIRNAGTLAGNLANGSPIGDTLPPLFVLGATVELASLAHGRRAVDVNEFYSGYRQTVMRDGEVIAAVTIPLPAPGDLFRLYKVSRRKDLDISTFSAAVWMRLDDAGAIADARLAYGGVGPTVVRLRRTEDALRGRPMSEETMRAANEVVQGEISAISDVRGSAEYRRLLAGNVLRKLWAELSAGDQFSLSRYSGRGQDEGSSA